MRQWGMVISIFYALILLAFIVPGAIFLALYKFEGWGKFLKTVNEAYGDWMLWLLFAAVLASQAFLLFLSVDTTGKRPKPRSHILVSVIVGALLTVLLSSAVIWSMGFAIRGEGFWKSFFDKEANLLFFWGLPLLPPPAWASPPASLSCSSPSAPVSSSSTKSASTPTLRVPLVPDFSPRSLASVTPWRSRLTLSQFSLQMDARHIPCIYRPYEHS